MSVYALELKSWRITRMFKFLLWIGLYLSLVLIGGYAGAGWAVVASLGVLYVLGMYFKKQVETKRSCRNGRKRED